jgi:hypothetical protein
MKKQINVMTVVMFLVALAAVLAKAKGFPATFGFSSGG